MKEFLHEPRESGALSFSEAEANLFVRESLRRYLSVVLPVYPRRYCPVPAKGNVTLETTVQAMAEYLNQKNLLEFALTVLPEEECLQHLMIFETSVHPPLMDQRDHWPWNQSLSHVSCQYFSYSCQQGLTVGLTNLLTIASILILSWPTSLRYGPLALAIKESSRVSASQESSERQELVRNAFNMVQAFSDTEENLVWECGGIRPSCEFLVLDSWHPRRGLLPCPPSQVQAPSRPQLADVVAGFKASHG